MFPSSYLFFSALAETRLPNHDNAGEWQVNMISLLLGVSVETLQTDILAGILANREGPDKIKQHATFYQGIHHYLLRRKQ